MKAYRLRSTWLGLLAAGLMAACAAPPEWSREEPQAVSATTVGEPTMLPLLGYLQRLQRMSTQELVRERNALTSAGQAPSTQVRLAMLLGQPRGPTDTVRALAILEGVLKSAEPAAAGLHPLARVLASQYSERLRLEMQNEKLAQQLKESQRRSNELQEKLEALADIERTLPARPIIGDNPPGVPR